MVRMGNQPAMEVPSELAPRTVLEPPPSDRWQQHRPGEVIFQPTGPLFGNPGPDIGYALRLAATLDIRGTPSENHDDLVAGGVEVAMARAAHFGRAPVKPDLVLAYSIWGLLPEGVPSGILERLAELRPPLFSGCAHDGRLRRMIVASVPQEVLTGVPVDIRRRVRNGEILVRPPAPG